MDEKTPPLEVTLVRTARQNAAAVVAFIFWLFVGAWALMLLAAFAVDADLGYWQTVALLGAARIVLTAPSRLLDWTDGERA